MVSIHDSQAARWRFRRSRGIALVVILILLMAITTVVAFSARHAVVGESSARNQMDYEVARQAAEAALRDGERDVWRQSTDQNDCNREDAKRFSVNHFTPDCLKGQCYVTPDVHKWVGKSATAESWWPDKYGGKWDNLSDKTSPDFKGGVPIGRCTGTPKVAQVQYQPEYLLEYLEKDPPVVRVTARGFGVTGHETQVVLQSYINIPLAAQ